MSRSTRSRTLPDQRAFFGLGAFRAMRRAGSDAVWHAFDSFVLVLKASPRSRRSCVRACGRHCAASGRSFAPKPEKAFVDLSMLESTVALLPGALLRAAPNQPPGETGSDSEPGAAPSGCFRCAGEDEWLSLSIRSNADWRALCEVMQRPELAKSGDWVDPAGRLLAKSEVNGNCRTPA